MNLKKSLIVPAALLAALTAGSLAGCVSTTESEVKTTSTSQAGTGFSFSWGADEEIKDMPESIPYLEDYDSAKATGDESKGEYELTINTGSKDAQADAGKLLEDAGFTADGHIYTNDDWKVELSGNKGTVVYTIEKA